MSELMQNETILRRIAEQHSDKIIKILPDCRSSEIENIIIEAIKAALKKESEKREQRPNNIPEGTDLVTEQRDDQGRRRYSLACIDDSPCMNPDKEGFWTPVNG